VGMLIEHRGKTMQVDPSACVAPTEDGEIPVGDHTMVMGSAPREVAGFLAARRVNGNRESCGDLPG
jgi:hypothetical protein